MDDFFAFFKKIGFLCIFGPPYCGIGATIRVGREMLCLPYAGFFFSVSEGALLNTLKLFVGKRKNALEFWSELLYKLCFLTASVYCRNKNLELIQNTLLMDVEKNNKFVCQKNFCVSEGALLNTLKLFLAKWKMHADFEVHYSKNYLFVTTSVHFRLKILNW